VVTELEELNEEAKVFFFFAVVHVHAWHPNGEDRSESKAAVVKIMVLMY
jgi:hypothetical protein